MKVEVTPAMGAIVTTDTMKEGKFYRITSCQTSPSFEENNGRVAWKMNGTAFTFDRTAIASLAYNYFVEPLPTGAVITITI